MPDLILQALHQALIEQGLDVELTSAQLYCNKPPTFFILHTTPHYESTLDTVITVISVEDDMLIVRTNQRNASGGIEILYVYLTDHKLQEKVAAHLRYVESGQHGQPPHPEFVKRWS